MKTREEVDRESKLFLQAMIARLNEENIGNMDKPPTYEIEYRRLLQWLVETALEATDIPETWEGGMDGGGELGRFERERDAEYRKRLCELRRKYGMSELL